MALPLPRPGPAIGTVLGALWLLLALVTGLLVLRARDTLLDELTAERARSLEGAAAGAQDSLDDVADDLGFATRLVGTTEDPTQRAVLLATLAGSVRAYRGAFLVGEEGGVELAVGDPRHPEVAVAEMEPLAAQAAADSLLPGSVGVQVSLPSEGPDHRWLRAFAARLPDGEGAVAVVVDTAQLLAPLSLLASEEATSLLVLGPHGRVLPVSTPGLEERLEAGRLEGVRSLVRSEPGLARMDAGLAAAAGFARADLLLSWHGLAMPGGDRWTVLTLSSTSAVRALESALVLRILGGALVAGGLLALGGAWLLRAAREAASLQERLRAADELAELRQRLIRTEKLATVGELAAGIAHEIGTPLGVIRGRAEYIRGKLGEDHPQAVGLSVIVEQIERVVRTIRALLDFSRADPAQVQPTLLAEVVDRATALLALAGEAVGVTLLVEVPDRSLRVLADPDQLEQVLVNLTKNAIDASPPGQAIVVRASRQGDRVRIEVVDRGHGILAADLNRVFDPFFTTRKRGQGTGLGLAVALQVVRSHGATLELDSAPERGTRAIVDWPVAA